MSDNEPRCSIRVQPTFFTSALHSHTCVRMIEFDGETNSYLTRGERKASAIWRAQAHATATDYIRNRVAFLLVDDHLRRRRNRNKSDSI